MGKASRRRRTTVKTAPAPFVARPFEGLPGEAEWVALREIIPAATATVTLAEHDAVPDQAVGSSVTIATVLPLAWPGLHRSDGTVFVATQSGSSSGDASRDLAAALLATLELAPGSSLPQSPPVTADTPRLQDLLVVDEPLRLTVHEGFDYWVADEEQSEDVAASLAQANEAIVPTTRVDGHPSAFHVRIGERSYVRIVLDDDEAMATDALARLHAAREDAFGAGTRLLGAFRACGLLVPVVEVPAASAPADHGDALAAWVARYDAAAASDAPLTAAERSARAGLLSRQVTLR